MNVELFLKHVGCGRAERPRSVSIEADDIRLPGGPTSVMKSVLQSDWNGGRRTEGGLRGRKDPRKGHDSERETNVTAIDGWGVSRGLGLRPEGSREVTENAVHRVRVRRRGRTLKDVRRGVVGHGQSHTVGIVTLRPVARRRQRAAHR